MSKAAREKQRRRERQIEEATAKFARMAPERTCLFCGGRAFVAGMWGVSNKLSRRMLVPQGKSRLIFYTLCQDHAGTPFHEIKAFLIRSAEQRIAAAGPNLN